MMLSESGFYHVWLAQGVGDVKILLSLFKQRLNDTFIQSWQTRLADSSRALFYRTISTFEYQKYLDFITVRKFRTSLTRLRVSSHRLAVEAGRWHKPISIPFDDRKCQVCNVLEDEFHFLFICPVYKELREKYICRFFRIKPNMFKLVALLHSDREIYIRNIGNYVFRAFEKRNEVLSQINRYL